MSPVVQAQLAHCASALCPVSAETAYAFLLDGHKLGQWALGSFATIEEQPGVFRGRSLFDDTTLLVRPVGNPQALRVDYHVGSTPSNLVPRITAMVVAGSTIGHEANVCQVNLLAWRNASMDDERWNQLVRAHELEILLIKARLKLENAVPSS